MTARLPKLEIGEEVGIEAPFGAISDRGGKACLLAAGAGITPFIPILRARRGEINSTQLIFSNKSSADIILQREWEEMEGLKLAFVVTDEEGGPIPKGLVDKDYLAQLYRGSGAVLLPLWAGRLRRCDARCANPDYS